MPSSTKAQRAAAARARAAKIQMEMVDILEISSDSAIQQSESEDDHDSDIECTGWTGGVNHVPSDTDTDSGDEDWKDTDLDGGSADSDEDDNEDLEDLEGEDLLDGLQKKWELLQQELEDLEKPTPYECILKKTTAKEWKKAEARRGLGYNGKSARRKREVAQQLREKEEQDRVVREGLVFQVKL
jgi:uncharacterized sporulation protein YeaH/YhbH (DUF444 family)